MIPCLLYDYQRYPTAEKKKHIAHPQSELPHHNQENIEAEKFSKLA